MTPASGPSAAMAAPGTAAEMPEPDTSGAPLRSSGELECVPPAGSGPASAGAWGDGAVRRPLLRGAAGDA